MSAIFYGIPFQDDDMGEFDKIALQWLREEHAAKPERWTEKVFNETISKQADGSTLVDGKWVEVEKTKAPWPTNESEVRWDAHIYFFDRLEKAVKKIKGVSLIEFSYEDCSQRALVIDDSVQYVDDGVEEITPLKNKNSWESLIFDVLEECGLGKIKTRGPRWHFAANTQ